MSFDPNNTILLAVVCIKAGIMPLMWGDPGCSKTAATPLIAKALGFVGDNDDGDFYNRPGFVMTAASYLQPEDVAGLASVGPNGAITRLHDDWIKLAADTPCLLVIDELNRAVNNATMNTLLRMIQEHMAGGLPLHSKTVMMGTANPTTSDGAREVNPACANRVAHLEWRIDTNDFIDYLMGGRGVMPELPNFPPTTEQHLSAARGMVASFLRANPLKAHMKPKDDLVTDKPWGRAICGPWASWRSWDNFARVIAVVSTLGDIRKAPYADLVYNLGLALVGPVAGEFHNFLAKSDLRSGSEVLDSGAYVVPKRIDILWAECMSASLEARHRNTLAAWHACLAVYHACAKAGISEIPSVCLPYLLGTNKGGPGVSAIMAGDLNNQPEIRKMALAMNALTGIYKG